VPVDRGLGGIVRVLVWAIAIYLAVAYGWPWLRSQLGSGSGGSSTDPAASAEATGGGGGGHCVALARQASESLGSTLRRFRTPPYDVDAWGSALTAVEDRVWEAESACSCGTPSCESASAALDELRDLLGSVDGVVRGDATSFRNPGRQQERIDELRDRAAEQARAGE
jgi:hypothetical protein